MLRGTVAPPPSEYRGGAANEQLRGNDTRGEEGRGDVGNGSGQEEEVVDAVGNRIEPADGENVEPSVEELVDTAVINLNEPCVNIPPLSPQELKIIGRCVNFQGETTLASGREPMHYEGLVSMITRDTVVLLHAYRFTADDFSRHQAKLLEEAQEDEEGDEEEEGHEDNGTRNGGANVARRQQHQQQQEGTENVRESRVPNQPNYSNDSRFDDANGIDCLLELHDAGNSGDESLMDMQMMRQGRLMESGSMGPLPYVTFSRRRIHNVVFARDPRSTFYSLFRDPRKHHFDMQCLRMFVRRYLVHTGQKNNPRNINLRPFIEWRCNCKEIDDNLLLRVAKEELLLLVKTERSMVKAAQRMSSNRRNALSAYQAPRGLFGATGFLFLTRIPVQTFCLAVLQILLAVMLLSYSAYAFSVAPNLIVHDYVKNYMFSVMMAGVSSLMASGLTVLHSLRMRLPLAVKVYSVFRFVLATIAIGLNVMVMVMVGEAVSFSHIYAYLYRLAGVTTDLCDYYEMHNCTGYGEVCSEENHSPICMWDECPGNRNGTCTQNLSISFTRVFVPIVVFSMVLIALFMIDHFLHYRLVQISRLLMAQL